MSAKAPWRNLLDLLEDRAAAFPDKPAYVFLSDRGARETQVTMADLPRRAAALARLLRARGGQPGDRALLVFPPGVEFFIGFFGCLYAQMIAVPMMPPRRAARRDASANILADCMPRFALTSEKFASGIGADLAARSGAPIEPVVIGEELSALARDDLRDRPRADDLAFLQYTSGSTSAPKGVMVTHDNLIANLAMIRTAFATTPQSTFVSWVPLYHDMGLILNALHALSAGASCVLMSPVSFLQRPLGWLKAICDFEAEVAGGPNFAFDLCVTRFRADQMEGIDLSGWRVAFNGAEPVRADTLHRFAKTFAPYGFAAQSLYPCYGMAEATLLISGGTPGAGATVHDVDRAALQALRAAPAGSETEAIATVGCGRVLAEEELAIVDPDTRQRLAADQIGEIWVRGPHIAQGYWQNKAATADAFGGEIANEPGAFWLRTGDLGFCDRDGTLFVTGRIKDVIILRGANHYPQDIEHTVQSADPSLRPGYGAAFAITDELDRDKVVVVQEVERTHRHKIDPAEIIANIREAVAEDHEISLHEIVLVRPGTIPKTTSGKIQRRLTRQLWQEGSLERLDGGEQRAEAGAQDQ